MKTNLVVLILAFSFMESFGQIRKENPHDIKKSEIGFLYYTDKEYPTFVPLKNQLRQIGITDFCTKALKSGIQLNWKQLSLDTLHKYEHSSTLLNYPLNNNNEGVILYIIPIKLSYTLFKYAKSNSQFKQNTNIDKLKLKDNYVVIKSFGGLPVQVDSVRAFKISMPKE